MDHHHKWNVEEATPTVFGGSSAFSIRGLTVGGGRVWGDWFNNDSGRRMWAR